MKQSTVKKYIKKKITKDKTKYVTKDSFELQFGFSAPTQKICFKKYQKPSQSNAVENGKLLLTKLNN